MNGTWISGLMLAAASLASEFTLAADDLLAVAPSGDVFTIDSSTGQGGLLSGARAFTDLNCLAKDAGGVMYAASGTALLTVDEFTGRMTAVATTDLDYVRGLAFAPDGTLYAIDDGGIALPDRLYTIDPRNGATALVAPTAHARIQGFAIDNAGNAFAWDTESGLLIVDLLTGETRNVNNQMDGSRDIGALAFSAAGELYGCGYLLYSLDPFTGAKSIIGSGGYVDVRGLAFIGAGNGRALRVDGRCPGRLTIEWSGATPNRLQALVIGAARGVLTIPNGQPCAGATLGLTGQVRMVDPPGPFSTGLGSGSLTGAAGTSACGRYLQLIEAAACATSNVAQIR